MGMLARLLPRATSLEDKAQAYAPFKTYFIFQPACKTLFSPRALLHLLHCIAPLRSQRDWQALNTGTEAEQQAIGDGDRDKVVFIFSCHFFHPFHGFQEALFVWSVILTGSCLMFMPCTGTKTNAVSLTCSFSGVFGSAFSWEGLLLRAVNEQMKIQSLEASKHVPV